MVNSTRSSHRQERIDANYRPDTTSELLSSITCGCPDSNREPIINMDSTIMTTCSSTTGGSAMDSGYNERENQNHIQSVKAFTNNVHQPYTSPGKITLNRLLSYLELY